MKLSWTNPNYSFTTGISSQDVSYTIQIDTAGANFTNPKRQEFAVAKDLSLTLLVGDLNTYLSKMELQTDVPHDIEMRVISNLNGAVPLQSNVIKFTGIVPYEDFTVPPPANQELYITGDGTPSGWTNEPPATQKCTTVNKGQYYIVMNFEPGKFYKFLSTQKQWQPQYGGKSATGGDIGFNLGSGSDPDAIPTPAAAGSYKVELNFKTGKYTVIKQ
ncbi:MAG: SusE domain-containing protein [Segetibacter sp.]